MRFLFQITLGIIRDQRHRRMTMFVVLLTALVLLFAGSTLLAGYLMDKPVVFLLYWFTCFWFTFLALLLAAYDLLLVRRASRYEREKLREAHLPDKP